MMFNVSNRRLRLIADLRTKQDLTTGKLRRNKNVIFKHFQKQKKLTLLICHLRTATVIQSLSHYAAVWNLPCIPVFLRYVHISYTNEPTKHIKPELKLIVITRTFISVS